MMKAIYTAVIAFFVAGVFLFIGSFIYMDKEKHRTYHYEISLNGCGVGTARIDKFQTEDRFIYKSSSIRPFLQDAAETREKITLDGKHTLESYSRERYYPKEIESVYIETKDPGVSFVSRSGPGFVCLEDIAVGKDPFIFKEDSPVTYLPIIENYDFSRGKAQGFSSMIYFPDREIPPTKRFVTVYQKMKSCSMTWNSSNNGCTQ